MTHIGLLLFPGLTQLDLTGPYEVFRRIPEAQVQLVWKTMDAVTSDGGLQILPTCTLAQCPPLDVLCVPGGPGQVDWMADDEVLGWIRAQAAGAQWVTSVCTGSLLLGAAGLLEGYRAACHWMSRDQLALLGALPSAGRVVVDRNRVTGGGVTAGIDIALSIVNDLAGEKAAQMVQLMIEYAPAPPFNAGRPETAPQEIVEEVRNRFAAFASARKQAIEKMVGAG